MITNTPLEPLEWFTTAFGVQSNPLSHCNCHSSDCTCSRYFTSPRLPKPAYPEGFQGNSIPIDGRVVARLVHERLSLAVEADD